MSATTGSLKRWTDEQLLELFHMHERGANPYEIARKLGEQFAPARFSVRSIKERLGHKPLARAPRKGTGRPGVAFHCVTPKADRSTLACLGCSKDFQSEDRRRNRLCRYCREGALAA